MQSISPGITGSPFDRLISLILQARPTGHFHKPIKNTSALSFLHLLTLQIVQIRHVPLQMSSWGFVHNPHCMMSSNALGLPQSVTLQILLELRVVKDLLAAYHTIDCQCLPVAFRVDQTIVTISFSIGSRSFSTVCSALRVTDHDINRLKRANNKSFQQQLNDTLISCDQ